MTRRQFLALLAGLSSLFVARWSSADDEVEDGYSDVYRDEYR